MKKLFLLAIALSAAVAANAQRRWYRPQQRSDDFSNVRVGVTGNLNIANTISSDNSDFSTRTKAGFAGGLFVDIPVAYPLSIDAELLYSQKGYRASTINGDFAQRANFIDVPLLLKFRLTPGFNVLAGPQFSFLTSTRNTYYDGFNTIYEERYKYDGDKNFITGVLGLSVDLNRNVELRGRYAIDLHENNPDGSGGVPEFRNQVWQFGLGFKF
ncbi:PorT family protein [Mucilaginibacter sp. Bleaf8]|uniref:porin family protein n=1 Tax=Mucilaginibacter sp. Bleaf8 TaxID=2834430 RepID=UPI001BCF97C3|nr:porin family protein [Mucilaginibacter sp. Bleaf8]MBS7566156.1 PorT family protein [Mucilaginibacter sp. Bleaf8]